MKNTRFNLKLVSGKVNRAGKMLPVLFFLLASLRCSNPEVEPLESKIIDPQSVLLLFSEIQQQPLDLDFTFQRAAIHFNNQDLRPIKEAFIAHNLMPYSSVAGARTLSDSLNLDAILADIDFSEGALTHLSRVENIVPEEDDINSPQNLSEALARLSEIEQSILGDPTLTESESIALLNAIEVLVVLLPEITAAVAEIEGLDSSNGRFFRRIWVRAKSVINHALLGAAGGAVIGFFAGGPAGAGVGAVIGGGITGTWGLILAAIPGAVCHNFSCGYHNCENGCVQ